MYLLSPALDEAQAEHAYQAFDSMWQALRVPHVALMQTHPIDDDEVKMVIWLRDAGFLDTVRKRFNWTVTETLPPSRWIGRVGHDADIRDFQQMHSES
jgi:hypothetical protein